VVAIDLKVFLLSRPDNMIFSISLFKGVAVVLLLWYFGVYKQHDIAREHSESIKLLKKTRKNSKFSFFENFSEYFFLENIETQFRP
jgi:hypothetical protein